MKTSRQIVAEIANQIDITSFLSARDYLREVYLAAKDRIPGYSYLKFADDLGFSETNVLRLVIVGQRTLTKKTAEKLAKHLELSGPRRRYWTNLVRHAIAKTPDERDRSFKLLMSNRHRAAPEALSDTQLEYYSAWYNPVIRELAAHPQFDGTPEWIKEQLTFTLRREQIVDSLEVLERIGEIAKSQETGRYLRRRGNSITDSEVDGIAIARYHQEMIEAGKSSITLIDEDQRDIRALTVRLRPDSVPMLKAKIESLLMEFLAMEQESATDEERVYQVNVQMFPFTKGKL